MRCWRDCGCSRTSAAILQTLYQYGHAMDYGPDADFIDCFAPDGVWDVRMRKTPGGAFTCAGHGEIAASLAAQTSVRAPALYAKHLLIEPRIVLDGDEASVQSYFVRIEPRTWNRLRSWLRVAISTACFDATTGGGESSNASPRSTTCD